MVRMVMMRNVKRQVPFIRTEACPRRDNTRMASTTNPEDEALLKESASWPLDRRISHSNWRVRSAAFDFVLDQTGAHAATKHALEQNVGLEASTCLVLLASSVGDPNANVMDRALDAFFAYLDALGTILVFVEGRESFDEIFVRAAQVIMKPLSTKCLKASKRTTLVKSIGVCGALVEVDQGMAVMQGLVEGGFSHKVPKAVAAALEAALEIVRGFYGTGEYDQRRMEDEVKELLGGIDASKLYAHRDAAVRARVKDLVVALMGTSKRVECLVRTKLLDKLPDAMQKEVLGDASRGAASGGANNERMYTKPVQKRLRELAAAQGAGGADEPCHGEGDVAAGYGDGDVEMMDVDVDVDSGREADQDPYEFAEPANVMPSLQKAKIKVDPDAEAVPFWDCFGSKKWNVRKAALEMVRDAALRAVRLDPAERNSYASLVREFKVILAKDANIHCAATAAMASEAMANALRSDFAGNAKLLCPDLLRRFKEKNPVMSKAAESCLQTFAVYCYSLKDVSEEITAALSVKNPKILADTLRYLACLVERESRPAVALCKDSLAAAVKLLSDADSNVRQEAQGAVVAFAVAMGGFAAVKTHLNGVDDKKREAIEKACGTASAGSSGIAGQRTHAMGKPAAAPRPGSSRDPGSSCPAPGRQVAARPVQAASAPTRPAGAPAKTTSTTTAKSGRSATFVENPVSKEDSEDILARTFGPGMVENLKSSLWQERVEAMSRIADRAEELFRGPNESEDAKRLLLALAHLPSWTDKNFQVVNKLFEVGTKAAEMSRGADFGPPHASCIVEGAVEKIHELKHRAQASTALTAACGRVGPKYVVSLVHQRAAWHKNPKVLAESLSWMQKTIDQFGYNNIDSKGSIVAWMTDDLSSTDPNVKSKALALLGECHSQVGAGPFQSLMDSLQSKKPALATSMQEAFAKKPMDASYQPTLAEEGESIQIADETEIGPEIGPEAALHGEIGIDVGVDIIPAVERVDVSRSLGDQLVAQLVSSNWKERNAAVESVEEVLGSAKHITADIPVEFLGALRKRFGDSNRNLAARSISLVGMLATAVGPDFDRIAHAILLGPAVENLADMKKQVREAVVGMLDAWGQTCPCDRLFPAMIDAVSNPKGASEGKVMALKWMVDHYEPNPRCRDSALKAAAAGAKDKAAPVRSIAAQLEKLVESTSADSGSLQKPSKRSEQTGVPGKHLPGRTPAAKAAPKPTVKSDAKSSVKSAAKSAPRSAGKHLGGPRPEARAGASQEMTDGMFLAMGQGKGVRSRQFRPRPGGFEPPTSDDRERLRDLLTPVASTMLAAKMFSGDFQDHIDALNFLVDGVPGRMNEILTSLDLLLRWIVLVLCEQNTQSSLGALDLLRVVLEHLADDGYRLSDMEASILLPAIIEKVGQNQDHMRSAYRSILVASASVYNPAKVVDMIVLGLDTKNSRSKVECCLAMSDIVRQTGGRCVTSAKNKPVVALSHLVSERDPALRSAAMDALESIRESGDEAQFAGMLGKANDGDRELVEGKLKPSLSGKADGAGGAIPIDVTTEMGIQKAHPQSQPQSHLKAYPEPMHVDPMPLEPTPLRAAETRGDGVQRTLDLESRPFEPPESPSGLATPVSRSIEASHRTASDSAAGVHTPVPIDLKSTPGKSVDGEISMMPQQKYDERAFEQRWERNIELMYSADLAQAVDATKHICSDIMMVTAKDGPPPSNRVKAVLSTTADKFVLAVCAQLEVIFADAARQVAQGGKNSEPPSSRGCKFALNALLQGLGIEDLAMGIPQGTLRTAISLLLCSLVDEHGLLCFEQGPTLVRAVNVLIAKMLDAANKNYAFAALLHLLRSPPTKSLGRDAVPKFNDLVVKCLIKLTKGLDSTDANIDISFILLCLHDYFMFLGVEEIRRRSAAEDKPLRMVKTILHQICKLVGYNVYQYTSSIPGRHAQPQPIIFRYIDINLKMLKEMNQLPTEDVGVATATRERMDEVKHYHSHHGDDEEVRVKLKDVLSRVTSKDPAVKDVSMRELLDLKRKHPQMVERYLNATQDRFRTYIEDCLREMNGRDGGGGRVAGGGGRVAGGGGRVAGGGGRVEGGGDRDGAAPAIPSVDNLAERLARLRQRM